ncbi:alpha/beta fold hydrolase [Paenibacillus thiaminolyticus]|uniref:alpha/beta fold hydrolase n=1 Tax=Paenibacillus thiaminolyticus TaxID=49283 RepID=UPI003D2694D3
MKDRLDIDWLVREEAPDLHLTVAGHEDAKATVVLVHGIGWHAGFYTGLMNRLRREGLRVVAVDLRGHGKSMGERGLHTYEELLEDTLDVVGAAIRKYGPDVYLFGTSFGASVAYYAAVREPRLKGLILHNAWDIRNLPVTIDKRRIDSLLSKYGHEPERMIPLPVMMGLRMTWHLFDNKLRLLGMFKDKLWHRKWSVRSWASFLGYTPVERHINGFNLPTLVITGDKDGMLPLDYTKEVFCNLATTEKDLAVVANAGHMLMIEHVEWTVPIISGWMDRRLARR